MWPNSFRARERGLTGGCQRKMADKGYRGTVGCLMEGQRGGRRGRKKQGSYEIGTSRRDLERSTDRYQYLRSQSSRGLIPRVVCAKRSGGYIL